MKYIYFAIAVIFVLIVSCKKDTEKKEVVTKLSIKNSKYSNPKDDVLLFDSIGFVNVKYKDSITTWSGYYRVKKTLESLKETTPNLVLNASQNLVADVVVMRDSIPVTGLKVKGMRARINGLYNQSLRLQEMNEIPSITVKEVIRQTKGLFVIFRTIDKKINAIYEQVDFEKELEEEDFFFSKIDSIQ